MNVHALVVLIVSRARGDWHGMPCGILLKKMCVALVSFLLGRIFHKFHVGTSVRESGMMRGDCSSTSIPLCFGDRHASFCIVPLSLDRGLGASGSLTSSHES